MTLTTKLRRTLAYATMNTSTLKATLATLAFFDVLPEQRAALTYELAVRAWAEAVEQRLGETIGWCRGGRS